MRAYDLESERISFGVELEVTVPITAGIEVGGYHEGAPVECGNVVTKLPGGKKGEGPVPQWARFVNEMTEPGVGPVACFLREFRAPSFYGKKWLAERDSSVKPSLDLSSQFVAVEFVSPILSGPRGVENVLMFVEWLRTIGARVNATYGCHVTISTASLTGTTDPKATAHFIRKLVRVTKRHSLAVYSQTGTARHTSPYCPPIPDETVSEANFLLRPTQEDFAARTQGFAVRCGRGMLNLGKAFGPKKTGLVEFRAFAGTVNPGKIKHHLATAFGLCRKAHSLPGISGVRIPPPGTRTAPGALVEMWQDLGWVEGPGSGPSVALGLCGDLRTDFGEHSRVALALSDRFEKKFPVAVL